MTVELNKLMEWGSPGKLESLFEAEKSKKIRKEVSELAHYLFSFINNNKDEWGPNHVPYIQQIGSQIKANASFGYDKVEMEKYCLEIEKIRLRAATTSVSLFPLGNQAIIPQVTWNIIASYLGYDYQKVYGFLTTDTNHTDERSVRDICTLAAKGFLDKTKIKIRDINRWSFMIKGFWEDATLIPIALEIIIRNSGAAGQRNAVNKPPTPAMLEFYSKRVMELEVKELYVPTYCNVIDFSQSKALNIQVAWELFRDMAKALQEEPQDLMRKSFCGPNDSFIEEYLPKFKSLTVYNACMSIHVTKESSFKYLLGRFQVLSIRYCDYLTDDAFNFKNFNLIALEIAYTSKITSNFLVNLSRNFPNLKVFFLHFAPQLNEECEELEPNKEHNIVFKKFNEISMLNLEFFGCNFETPFIFDKKNFPKFVSKVRVNIRNIYDFLNSSPLFTFLTPIKNSDGGMTYKINPINNDILEPIKKGILEKNKMMPSNVVEMDDDMKTDD